MGEHESEAERDRSVTRPGLLPHEELCAWRGRREGSAVEQYFESERLLTTARSSGGTSQVEGKPAKE